MMSSFLTEFRQTLIITVILSVGGTVLMWPFRKAKIILEDLKSSLNEMHTELVTQRQNCLTTLQSQGAKQIEVLEKMSDTLIDMHLDQKTTLGMLQGRGNRL